MSSKNWTTLICVKISDIINKKSGGRMKMKHDLVFKTKVAIDAIKEEDTLSVLSGKYDVHSDRIINWKHTAIDS